MAHLWIKLSDCWQPQIIEQDELTLATPLLTGSGLGRPPSPAPRMKRFTDSCGSEEWLIIFPPGAARINGIPDRMGFRLLHDKDEIRIQGLEPFYFSSERKGRVEKFTGADHAVYCPRCRDAVEADGQAVKCPGCQTWYHQRSDRPCWTYAPTCGLCPQPTDLTGSFRWTPEEQLDQS